MMQIILFSPKRIIFNDTSITKSAINFEKKLLFMNIYQDYIQEIEERKSQGLHPKPIDGAELLSEIISQIKDLDNAHREDFSSVFYL